jgi:predicted short-subunit dehydrogenase-like oxidoreductase (DUF2520 family)
VPDHKLTDVLDGIDCSADTVVAHTAGSYGLDIFPGRIMRKGVFYPLQTFTAGRDVDFRDLPLLLECSDKYSSDILEAIAESVGGKVYNMDAGHRKYIHLAAVFVCNFTNHMLTLGQEISGRSGLTGDILIPLIKETFMRAVESGPEYSQTGPAVRNDQTTIEEHIKLLSFSPGLQEIYRHITRSITDYYKVT